MSSDVRASWYMPLDLMELPQFIAAEGEDAVLGGERPQFRPRVNDSRFSASVYQRGLVSSVAEKHGFADAF